MIRGPGKGQDMTVTLNKCEFGCKNKRPEDFSRHTNWGESICDWCAAMWEHDKGCCEPIRKCLSH